VYIVWHSETTYTAQSWTASGKMSVAKVQVGILRVEVRASTRLVRYFYTDSQFTRHDRIRAQLEFS